MEGAFSSVDDGLKVVLAKTLVKKGSRVCEKLKQVAGGKESIGTYLLPNFCNSEVIDLPSLHSLGFCILEVC